MAGVERAVPVLKSFRFVSRDFQAEDTVIDVGGVSIGGGTSRRRRSLCSGIARPGDADRRGGQEVRRPDIPR